MTSTRRPLFAAALLLAAAISFLPTSVNAHGIDPLNPIGIISVDMSPLPPKQTAVVPAPNFELWFTVAAGREAIVLGVNDEPYLRIAPDATTYVNTLSPTRYINAGIYVGVDIPPAAANYNPLVDEPDWERLPYSRAVQWFERRAEVHDHSHDHDTAVETSADMGIDIAVTPDTKAGHNLTITTSNFIWSAQNASAGHVDGQGHAHLYINGEKQGRLYGPDHHLDLKPGTNEIRVTLNTNDHAAYTRQGQPIEASFTIEVPGETEGHSSHHNGHTHESHHGHTTEAENLRWTVPVLIDGERYDITGVSGSTRDVTITPFPSEDTEMPGSDHWKIFFVVAMAGGLISGAVIARYGLWRRNPDLTDDEFLGTDKHQVGHD